MTTLVTRSAEVSPRWNGGTLQSVYASTATGAGQDYDLNAAYTKFAISVIAVSTVGVYKLQGSVDRANWFDMKTGVKSGAGTIAPTPSTTAYPVRFVRINTTTKSTTQANGYIIVGR